MGSRLGDWVGIRIYGSNGGLVRIRASASEETPPVAIVAPGGSTFNSSSFSCFSGIC